MGKLNFRSITIRKAPGFRNGLYVKGFDELSQGINIITGPNGAGKSTTARIIQQLIWHNHTGGLDIEGTMRIDDSDWSVHIDSSYIRIQRDGTDALLYDIPPAEAQKVYMLALHELVNVKDEDLAKRIMDESIGGYDLDAAGKKLAYSEVIKSKSAGEYTNYKKAIDKLKEITGIHKIIKEKEETLSQLKSEKAEAKEAWRLKEFYGKTAEFLQAKIDLTKATEILNTYPDVLKEVSGDEFKRLEELEQEIAAENAAISEAQKIIKEKEALINSLPLPEKGIDDKKLNELKERIALLAEIEKDIRTGDPEIRRLETLESEAKHNIDNLKNPDQWKGIKLDDVGDLDNFFQNALTVIQRKISVEAEIERLKKQVGELKTGAEITDTENTRNGIRILSDWLKEQRVKSRPPLWIIILISVVGILTAVTTYYMSPEGLIGIPAILVLLVVAFVINGRGKKDKILIFRQNDFINTGLTLPVQWDAESVSARLEELMRALNKALKMETDEKSRSGFLEIHYETLNRLQSEIDKVNKTRELLLERIHAMPEFPENAGHNLSTLYLFLVELKNWQTAYTALESAKTAQEMRVSQRDSVLNECNLIFDALQADHATDSLSAKAIFNMLSEYENKRRDAKKSIDLNEILSANGKERLNNTNNRVLAIYQKLKVENGNKEDVRRLTDLFEDFKEAGQEYHTAMVNFKREETELRSHSLFQEYADKIKYLEMDKVQETITELGSKADKLIDLSNQITEIETLIKQKKEGKELEDGLSGRNIALTELEDLYESNLSSITGALLLEHLKTETGEQSRPEVFRLANKIFNRITRGRYELRVADAHNNGPVFRAYDTVLRQGQELSEISTGTRVQLLLAIRLAFIEFNENNVKLPVLADELLANSDDTRAGAIIEALCEICKEGRQVFYFTAQPVEVGKWTSYLKEKKDIEYKVISLGADQGEDKRIVSRYAGMKTMEFVHEVPDPGKSTMAEYRKKLKVLLFDPVTDDTAQVSIVYLTKDVNLLYHCLRSGIRNWGQLESFYRVNGKIPGLDQNTFNIMKNKAGLLEYYRELYRLGRPGPINMDVLEQSNAITNSFIYQVKQKLEEAKGDPARLLEILPDIPRFRRETIRQIRDYLTENRYLDDHGPLDDDEIRVRLQAKSSHLGISPEEAQDFINGIIGR